MSARCALFCPEGGRRSERDFPTDLWAWASKSNYKGISSYKRRKDADAHLLLPNFVVSQPYRTLCTPFALRLHSLCTPLSHP